MALTKSKVEVYDALSIVIMRIFLAFSVALILMTGFGFFIYFLYIDKSEAAWGVFAADSIFVAVILLVYKFYFKK